MRRLFALSWALLAIGCAAETSSPAVADHFEVVSGDAQHGTFGRPLDSLVTLRLVDDRGAAVIGAPVAWSVTAGGGRLEEVSTTTGADGLVIGRWVLGNLPGDQTVQVAAVGLAPLGLAAAVDGFRATAIAASGSAVCALDSLGSAWCWGGHGYAQTGAHYYGAAPVMIDSGHAFRQIAAGTDHFCALTEVGGAWCWGFGARGELGSGAAVAATLTPLPVVGGHTFTSIAAATWTTCAIDQSGQAWCWGIPGDGDLGTDNAASPFSPAPVQQGTTVFSSISLGYEHICALEPDGQAWCWGHQDVGQLGDSTNNDASVPVRVAGTTRFRAVSAGDHFTCGIAIDQALWCWGAPPLAPYRERRSPAAIGVHGVGQIVGDDQFMVGVKAARPLSAGSSWYTGAPPELGTSTLTEMPGDLYAIRQITLRWATICMIRSDDVVFCAGEVPGYGSTATPVAFLAP